MPLKKIAVIFGTRPDTIKQAPIIHALKQQPDRFSVLAIATAQHRKMLDQVLEVFEIRPNYDLNVMLPNQTLAVLTKNIIEALDDVLVKERPDMVLVQGDTSTTFVGSLAAFYRNIPVGHVEAGLRTNDRHNPFPEEINRRLTTAISELHFAPTQTAKKAILKENIDRANVFVTGNTVIDALYMALKKKHHFTDPVLEKIVTSDQSIILLTMHRRENWGEPMRGACNAIKSLANEFPDMNIVFPVHLNPVVRDVVYPILGNCANVHLIEPLDYLDFINVMAKSKLIITDSGGVQEEGPALGKPILVLRKVTERPEAVAFGAVKLVGLDEKHIFNTAKKLLSDQRVYRAMANATNPYGDGKAAERTVRIIENYFGLAKNRIRDFIPRASSRKK
jgi:UDP-N-acetylglucosamine 2-epimerase (non-hydrolysing)